MEAMNATDNHQEKMMTTTAQLNYIAERLGTDATQDDAAQVAAMASAIAKEQGDECFELIDWLYNRTYEWTDLWEAANGNTAALLKVRTEAGLVALS